MLPRLLIHCLDELVTEAEELLVDDRAEATAPQRLVDKLGLRVGGVQLRSAWDRRADSDGA